MIDDNTIGDATRNPGGETPEPVGRTGVRAAAKKATKKVAKKTAKKVVKKAAKKATKKTAKKAAKKTAGASGRGGGGRARKKTAEKAAKPAAAASTVSETAAPRAAASGTAAPETAPPETSASGAVAASDTAPSGAATPETAADGSPRSAKHVPSADAARRIGPAYPGALMTGTESEDPGGIGSLLALWGPLVIIGFLVLVFLGGDDPGETTASGHDDAPAPASVMPSTTAGMEVPQTSGPMPDPASGEAGASPRFAASRVAAAWTDPGGAWPAPPGPYRNPESYGPPAGERWVAHLGEWAPSADGRGVPGYGDGGNPPPQWVRCEAPYYWCRAPSEPAW